MTRRPLTLLPRQVAYARFVYAALSLFTPRLAASTLGVATSEMTPAAVTWAAVFASREAALGALSLTSEGSEPTARRKALYLNVAVDAIDALSLLALARRHRQTRPLIVAVPAALTSTIIHLQAAQRIGQDPLETGRRTGWAAELADG